MSLTKINTKKTSDKSPKKKPKPKVKPVKKPNKPKVKPAKGILVSKDAVKAMLKEVYAEEFPAKPANGTYDGSARPSDLKDCLHLQKPNKSENEVLVNLRERIAELVKMGYSATSIIDVIMPDTSKIPDILLNSYGQTHKIVKKRDLIWNIAIEMGAVPLHEHEKKKKVWEQQEIC